MAVPMIAVKLAAMRKPIHQPRGALFSVTRQTVSLIDLNVTPSPVSGDSPSSLIGRFQDDILGSSSFTLTATHRRVRVADLAEVRGPRPCAELREEAIAPILRAPPGNLALRIAKVAEDDRFGRADLLARRDDLAVLDRFPRPLRLNLGFLYPLDAVRALLHHAAHANSDVRVEV